MPTQDTSQIKEKIVAFIRRNGPSLPVHIAREIGQSILFTSAFLSEVLSEKKIKTSNMKIGSSPLYLLPGQENQLEKFSHHLKSREKDAFNLLKERKILKDSELGPVIRVAIREIKDFAIPFRKNGELYWRFFTAPENSFPKAKPNESQESPKKVPKSPKGQAPEQKEEPLGIFDNSQKKQEIPKNKKKKKQKKKSMQKENNFFTKIKESLSNKSIELLDILVFNRNEIALKVRRNDEERILIAFNKKRLNEKDIIKASKKAKELGNRKYIIMGNGDLLKRTDELISAVKNLSSIEKVE